MADMLTKRVPVGAGKTFTNPNIQSCSTSQYIEHLQTFAKHLQTFAKHSQTQTFNLVRRLNMRFAAWETIYYTFCLKSQRILPNK